MRRASGPVLMSRADTVYKTPEHWSNVSFVGCIPCKKQSVSSTTRKYEFYITVDGVDQKLVGVQLEEMD